MSITSKIHSSKCESPSFMCYNKLYKAKRKVTFQRKSSRKKIKSFPMRKRCHLETLLKKKKEKKTFPMETLMQ